MVETHFAKFGESLRYSQSSRTCSTFANAHEICGVVARYGNKKRRFTMLLGFGGTVLVLLFYVRDRKVWRAQSRNPLEMLVGTSCAHFPYLRNKGSWQWRQLRPEWKPQHCSGKNSQEVATPTCCEACENFDMLWKLTFRVYRELWSTIQACSIKTRCGSVVENLSLHFENINCLVTDLLWPNMVAWWRWQFLPSFSVPH